MNPNAIFNWNDDGVRYERGFKIGSEGPKGEHRPNATGWPYSIFKKANDLGITDVVLCHGIQDLDDARVLLEIIENTDRRPVAEPPREVNYDCDPIAEQRTDASDFDK